MSRSQGKPITKDEIRRIQVLLADTDLTMTMISERMNCTRSSISKINKEFSIWEKYWRKLTESWSPEVI